MSAAAILERLHRDGVRVRAAGAQVLLAPREKVTPDVLELVRANKPALLEALKRSAAAAAATLERRRARVEHELAQHPEQRVAADVADAPLRPEPGEPVSVVIAVRTAVGIVSGEMTAPRERFDTATFFAYLAGISEAS